MMLYLMLGIVAVLIALYYYTTRTFNYWKKRNVKYPKPVPLFGNILEPALCTKHYYIRLKEIYDQFPDEKVVGVYRMTTPFILIRDLDIIKQIMIKDFDKFTDRGIQYSKEQMGVNLVHANGDAWRILRKRFTPMFSSGKLKNMLHLMIEAGDQFVDYICTETQKTIELKTTSLVQKYFMSTISACIFGLNVDIYSTEQIKQLQKLDKYIFTKTIFFELDMMFPGILLKFNKSLYPRQVTFFFYNIVNLVFTERKETPSNRRDFMDLFLEMKKEGELHMKNEEIRGKTSTVLVNDSLVAAQAFVFYAAGYETSATTMACMLYLLAKHQDVQDKVREDIEEYLQKCNGNITYDVLNEMKYFDKVYSETLRLYSVADKIVRVAKEDYQIPGTDVVIAKGQTVLLSAHGIHYDKMYYPNPEKFDPERFSPDNIRKRHICASMSFGVGPRSCIGIRFGKLMSAVCIIKLLSKFKLELSSNSPDKINYDTKRFLLFPEGEIPLNYVLLKKD